MRIANPNLYPKGGHVFKESDGATIRGDSWPGVIARVVRYRARAKYPPGNPTEEVYAQACARNPGLCGDAPAPQKSVPLKTRVLMWLNGLVQKKRDLAFVSESLAKERAGICARCPKNTDVTSGCASCKVAQSELRKAIAGGRFFDGRLRGCAVLGEDLPVAVHLELQAVEDGELPGECWRKRKL